MVSCLLLIANARVRVQSGSCEISDAASGTEHILVFFKHVVLHLPFNISVVLHTLLLSESETTDHGSKDLSLSFS
jgi:hypothetical protein